MRGRLGRVRDKRSRPPKMDRQVPHSPAPPLLFNQGRADRLKASAVLAPRSRRPRPGKGGWARRGDLGSPRGLQSPGHLWPTGSSLRENMVHVYGHGSPRLAHGARDSAVTLRPGHLRHQSEVAGPLGLVRLLSFPGGSLRGCPPSAPDAAGLDEEVFAHLYLPLLLLSCRLPA